MHRSAFALSLLSRKSARKFQGSLRLPVRARCGFSTRKSYGPVRCGLEKAEIVQRFGTVLKIIISYGAVLRCDISYGGVRCGLENLKIVRCGSVRFSDMANITVQLGAVPR